MTTKFHLIVNGNRFVAANAAADYGVGFAFKTDYAMRNDLAPGEWRTVGYGSLEQQNAIDAWYRESNQNDDATRKPGALLCYHAI